MSLHSLRLHAYTVESDPAQPKVFEAFCHEISKAWQPGRHRPYDASSVAFDLIMSCPDGSIILSTLSGKVT